MNNSNELITLVETSGLESKTATTLKERFLPFFEQADEWKKKAESLVVSDATQIAEMRMAREARLALKAIRVNADKTRKELKEDSLRYGKAVQGIYNVIEYRILPIEQHLEQQEKFVEIQEANRKAKLKSDREAELLPFSEFVPFGLDLGGMSDEDYVKTLNGAKLQFEQKIEAENKAREAELQRQKAEAEERERIRLENERLREEAALKEKQLAEERSKAEAERKAIEEKARQERLIAEARLKAEVEAKAKIEAELKAREEAEKRRQQEAMMAEQAEIKARKEAERKAKAAPDKIKLENLAQQLEDMAFPDVKSDEAVTVINDVKQLITKVCVFIREKNAKI